MKTLCLSAIAFLMLCGCAVKESQTQKSSTTIECKMICEDNQCSQKCVNIDD